MNLDRSRRDQKGGTYGELRAYSRRTEREIGRESLSGPNDLNAAFERLLAKGASENELAIHFVPSAGTRNRIPTSPVDRKIIVSELEKYVTEELSHLLSPADLELFRQHGLEPYDVAALLRIYAAMDTVILQAAVEHGPVVFLVPEILQRVTDWVLEGDDGVRRWKRLGRGFARRSEVMRGLRNTPLEPRWVRSRGAIVQEVKGLRKSLRAYFAGRIRLPPDWIMSDAAADTFEREPDTFPNLREIAGSFEGFVHADPVPLRLLLAGNLTPALFADQLIGWITNYAPGSVAQIIRRRS